MNEIAISVKDISKSFMIDGMRNIFKKSASGPKSKLLALDNVSFDAMKGEVLGIIGLNGSGKTTLLRIIAGVYKPDSGLVKVNGRLSPLMQLGTGFQGDLNAKENIMMNGMLLGLSKNEIESKVDEIIEYAELKRFVNLKLKHYSSGMRARLAFSTAMQVNPDILLVDEIMSVGDKDFRKKSSEKFLSFKQQNKTIIHVTHNIQHLRENSDRILLLDKGKVVDIGKPEIIIKKYNELKPKK